MSEKRESDSQFQPFRPPEYLVHLDIDTGAETIDPNPWEEDFFDPAISEEEIQEIHKIDDFNKALDAVYSLNDYKEQNPNIDLAVSLIEESGEETETIQRMRSIFNIYLAEYCDRIASGAYSVMRKPNDIGMAKKIFSKHAFALNKPAQVELIEGFEISLDKHVFSLANEFIEDTGEENFQPNRAAATFTLTKASSLERREAMSRELFA